jgi:hypothetical protein
MLLIKLILNRELSLEDLKQLTPAIGTNFILLPDAAPDCYLLPKFKFSTPHHGVNAMRTFDSENALNYSPGISSMGIPTSNHPMHIRTNERKFFHEDAIEEPFTEETSEQHVNIAFQLVTEFITAHETQLLFIPYKDGTPIIGDTEAVKINIENVSSLAEKISIFNIDEALAYVKGEKVVSQTKMPKPSTPTNKPQEDKSSAPLVEAAEITSPPATPSKSSFFKRAAIQPFLSPEQKDTIEAIQDTDEGSDSEPDTPRRCCYRKSATSH